MRAVVQRVTSARVTVDDEVVAELGLGVCVLVGVGRDDLNDDAESLADKVVGLRIFEDDAQKMNRSVLEAGGDVLAVSQFTLYGDVRRGRRPSFGEAMEPEAARALFERFCEACRVRGARVETGRFRANMKLELVNDGPVTIFIDSKRAF